VNCHCLLVSWARKEVNAVATLRRPSKAELSKAGKALQDPRTREKDETKAAGRKRKGR